MKRLFGAHALALFALLAFAPLLLNSCSNPSSAPGTTTTPANYSASAFFGTESLGDTSTVPFPFCFPAQYLQQKLGLTDTQIIAIQYLQDSLRLALQAKLDSLRASGTISVDSIRALRLEFQTDLYTGIAAILTPAQLTALRSLEPPLEGPGSFGHGPWRHRGDTDANDSARVQLTPAQRDSLTLARLEAIEAAAGDTLSASQITLIQDLQTSLAADTTLSWDQKHAQFEAQLQTILTANQLSALAAGGEADHRHHRWHG